MLEGEAVTQLDHPRQETGVDDQHARPAVVQAPPQPLALEVDVRRHPDGSDAIDREAQQHEFGAALHQNGDGVAPAHPQRMQPGGELVGAPVDVGEGEVPVARHDEHVVARLLGLQSQHPVEQAVVAVGEVETVHRRMEAAPTPRMSPPRSGCSCTLSTANAPTKLAAPAMRCTRAPTTERRRP